MDFFDMQADMNAPLAQRMRPRTRRIRSAASACPRLPSAPGNRGRPHDLVYFLRPAGNGQNKPCQIISLRGNAAFEQLNAVTAGCRAARNIRRQRALKAVGRVTHLLLDECHRWSKAQSTRCFPPWRTAIGSTTENPNIAMTPAILSRCMVFSVLSSPPDDIRTALLRAIRLSAATAIRILPSPRRR